jgi:hypothetical protein
MNNQARITYLLSERGRKDSLLKGGDGKRKQIVLGVVSDPADLEIFKVDEEGQASFDATTAPEQTERNDKYHWVLIGQRDSPGYFEVDWDVVPTWDDLLQFGRWAEDVIKQQLTEATIAHEEDLAEEKRVADAFLADPSARADIIEEDSVTIEGHDFWSNEVVSEAKARWRRDQEELKRANRATLAEWINKHGTANQRQRLANGLLPWKEAFEAAEEHLYAPLAEFPLYKRFEIEEVCQPEGDEGLCKVKFQSVDATELTADEWDTYSKIRAVIHNATFQLREHRAQCNHTVEWLVRRGVIVKFSLGQLTWKREFAL